MVAHLRPFRLHAIGVSLILGLTALIEWAMGRPPICTCGSVKLWTGVVNGPENSQMVADWYSLSHVVHGLLLFWVLWLAARRRSILNSMGDVVFMMLGFGLARLLPVRASAAVGLGLELISLAAIHDNLALNVLMLVYPIDAIRVWQGG